MKKIAIFASGAGSNADKIIQYFKAKSEVSSSPACIALIVTNKSDAGVLKIAEIHTIPSRILEKEKFFRGNGYVEELQSAGIDFIVLAGFLWKLPDVFIRAYPKKIVNIHPALLPKYGGKGMYGQHVHKAVLAAREKESGITIHYVDEHYDHGQIILQAKCRIDKEDTPETLARKVQLLEHRHYPPAIDLLLTL